MFFLFNHARQAHNLKNQVFLTSKYKSASIVLRKNITPKYILMQIKVKMDCIQLQGCRKSVKEQRSFQPRFHLISF